MSFNRKISAFVLALFLTVFILSSHAQEIKNIRVTQEGNRVNVLYDLAGKGQTFKVELFYSTNDGQNWQGPLKGASGDAGTNVQPGNNKQIIWDVQSEPGLKEGFLQFKVIAEVTVTSIMAQTNTNKPKPDLKISKYKTGKNISLTLALTSAGAGVFTYIQGNKLYDEYKIATDDAAGLHKKIETYDKITPVAFAIAGASTVSFIIYASKYGKAKKQLSFQPFPLQDGGGLAVSFTF